MATPLRSRVSVQRNVGVRTVLAPIVVNPQPKPVQLVVASGGTTGELAPIRVIVTNPPSNITVAPGTYRDNATSAVLVVEDPMEVAPVESGPMFSGSDSVFPVATVPGDPIQVVSDAVVIDQEQFGGSGNEDPMDFTSGAGSFDADAAVSADGFGEDPMDFTSGAGSFSADDAVTDSLLLVDNQDTALPFDLGVPMIVRLPGTPYPSDNLSLAETRIENEGFVPVNVNGIIAYRPELISVIDFASIWKPSGDYNQNILARENSAIGNLINAQYQALNLRQETLLSTIKNMYLMNVGSIPRQIFFRLREEFRVNATKLGKDIRVLYNLLSIGDGAKEALKIRTIPSNLFNANSLPLQELFQRKLQYQRIQFESFSNTKVLLQLLLDLRAISENYSFDLLDLNDTDRVGDFDPVKLDSTYTLTNGFTFHIADVRSAKETINATKTKYFDSFLASLPADADERIRLLTVVLTKEFLFSKGLGKEAVQNTLRTSYKTEPIGNPFNNIIGEIGNTIFDSIKGYNSLASLMFVDVPNVDSATVLAFESKYIDTTSKTSTYVPGANYFMDSVLELKNGHFNTDPFTNYVQAFNDNVSKAKQVIEALLDVEDPEGNLKPTRINDQLIGTVSKCISGLVVADEINRDQSAITALFKLAANDNDLKNKLFQFCLLVGMGDNFSDNEKEIFRLLATELYSTENVSYFKDRKPAVELALGISVLGPFIEDLATEIQSRVEFIVRQGHNQENNNHVPAIIDLPPDNLKEILLAAPGNRMPNFIQAFRFHAANISDHAQLQGSPTYLVPDNSGRTRFNYVSTSMQLLMLFELINSYVVRYSDASFTAVTPNRTLRIEIDSEFNSFVVASIVEILRTNQVPQFFTGSIIVVNEPFDELDHANWVGEGGDGGGGIIGEGSGGGLDDDGDMEAWNGLPDDGNDADSIEPFDSLDSNANPNGPVAGDLLAVDPLAGQPGHDMTDWSLNFLPDHIRALMEEFAICRLTYNALVTNRTKIDGELNTILNILEVFEVIGQRLTNYSNDLRGETMFNISLYEFIDEYGLETFNLLKNPSQIKTAAWLLTNIKEKTPAWSVRSGGRGTVTNGLVLSDIITESEFNTLLSLLSEHQFEPTQERFTKLLTVGIPAGMSTALVDRIDVEHLNQNTFKEKEFDVIRINVYRRDARFDDVVFKPKSFIFDLSLFTLDKDVDDIKPRTDENFTRLMDRVKLTDFTRLKDMNDVSIMTGEKVTKDNIKTNPKYDFLSTSEKESIVSNHIVSHMLKDYINLTTGLTISEESFLRNEDFDVSLTILQDLQNAVIQYLVTARGKIINPNVTFKQLLESNTIDAETRDIISLFINGSVVLAPEEMNERVLGPKMFDRVFNVPLYVEDFEIDVEKTNKTQSGRRLWTQAYFQDKIVRQIVPVGGNTNVTTRYFMKPRTDNDLMFEDYFVTIETGQK